MSTKDKIDFAHAMGKHSKATARDLQRLMRYGATHARIATDQCNGPDYDRCRNDAERLRVSQRWQEYQDKLPAKLEHIRAAIRKICQSFGADVVFQGDPRGCTVKIVVPDGYTNDFGREGICVPTS